MSGDTPKPRRWTLIRGIQTDAVANRQWEVAPGERVEVVETAAYDELQRERDDAIRRFVVADAGRALRKRQAERAEAERDAAVAKFAKERADCIGLERERDAAVELLRRLIVGYRGARDDARALPRRPGKAVSTQDKERGEGDEATVRRVWDPVLQVTRPLAEDEWELESHWAGLLEVHGEKMPGHSWVLVVPKWKFDAAVAERDEAVANAVIRLDGVKIDAALNETNRSLRAELRECRERLERAERELRESSME